MGYASKPHVRLVWIGIQSFPWLGMKGVPFVFRKSHTLDIDKCFKSYRKLEAKQTVICCLSDAAIEDHDLKASNPQRVKPKGF